MSTTRIRKATRMAATPSPVLGPRVARGRTAQRNGVAAENLVVETLFAAGWVILGRRLRTEAGEIDIAAEKDGILSIIEVKSRMALDVAAYALGPSQRARLIGAAEILLGAHPGWGRAGVRFDLWLVGAGGALRQVADAFRAGD
ncbi:MULTISPECIES: YraN family protein [unclassified Acidisoma]|uniref:YraN family protein n=1 Tax=unclassified Acidisoma TaxID=2634065 RepID=UPI0020B16AD0|nr:MULTISPECIES: YraN family protein [unclassified Acidisoma]